MKDVLLSDLKYRHIDRLSKQLDNGRTNWKDLGSVIFQGDQHAKDELGNVHLSFIGGGNPAKEFLEKLSREYPTYTIKEFSDLAVRFKRNDIWYYISSLNHPEKQYLRNLDKQNIHKISIYLNNNTPGIYNWRMFADEIGFTSEEIKTLEEQGVKKYNQHSPTETLIKMIKSKYPLMTLTKLIAYTVMISRNDIAEDLRCVLKELQ